MRPHPVEDAPSARSWPVNNVLVLAYRRRRAPRPHHCTLPDLCRSRQRHQHWCHLRTTSTNVRSSLDVQLKWSEAQRVGLTQQGALLTACQEGPSRPASFKFITIPTTTPHTLQRTLSRAYASYGTETARACGRCVTGLDGRWLRRMLQRRRLNEGERCENAQRLLLGV